MRYTRQLSDRLRPTFIGGGTVTNSTRKTGGPGFWLYNDNSNNYNAYFDNFEICTLP